MGCWKVLISEEQSRAAYERRKRSTWPEGYEAAMADPICHRFVMLEAYRHARRASVAAALGQRTQARRMPAPARAYQAPTPTLAPAMDHKRLAAGERDDD